MRSFQTRLTSTMVGLVSVTAIILAGGSWVVIARSLRADLAERAIAQVEFNVGVLAASPERLSNQPTLSELEESPLVSEFRLRGTDGVYVELDDGAYFSGFAFNRPPSAELRRVVADGSLATEWVDLSGAPYLMVGARRPPDGPQFYFFFDAGVLSETLRQLALVLGAGVVIVVLVAVSVGRSVAKKVLTPVRRAAVAAEEIASGDLSTRLDATGEDEFGAWVAAFNRMARSLEAHVQRLEEAQEAQQRFISDASHELRTPLSALVNEAAAIKGHLDDLPVGAARMAELLSADVDRLRKLTADLLETSRLDAGIRLEPQPTDLRNFTRTVLDRRSPTVPISVRVSGIANVDRQALERVIGNLVDNALTHAPGSKLEIEGVADDTGLTVRVIDHGPGVPPGDLSRLFERFWKGDPSRSGVGSGLGLAIARDYARILGGDLSAFPTPGGGLTVELTVTNLLPPGDGDVTTGVQHGGAGKEQL